MHNSADAVLEVPNHRTLHRDESHPRGSTATEGAVTDCGTIFTVQPIIPGPAVQGCSSWYEQQDGPLGAGVRQHTQRNSTRTAEASYKDDNLHGALEPVHMLDICARTQ